MPHVIAPGDLYLAPLGDFVERGQVVEVTEPVATSLAEQGWERSYAADQDDDAEPADELGEPAEGPTTTPADHSAAPRSNP